MAFDAEKFRRQMDEALNIADGIKNPLVVRARAVIQAGQEILVGRCSCGQVAALAGEGKHLCRKCWRWLRYVRG